LRVNCTDFPPLEQDVAIIVPRPNVKVNKGLILIMVIRHGMQDATHRNALWFS
jgi:hypothetical protein